PEVGPEPCLDVDPVRAAHGEDGPVAGRDRAEGGFLCAQPELEAPVGAFPVRPVRRLVRGAAGDVADVLVGEAADELPQSVAPPHRIRVREADDPAARLTDTAVLRGNLAAARAPDAHRSPA